MTRLLGVVCILVLLFNGTATTTNDHKAQVVKDIAGMSKQAQVMVDMVFSFAELGFQEVETAKYLTGVLEKEGFKIEHGIAGIPTAWIATYGSGKPVIALGSDVDCIPQASQKPGVAYHDPLIDGAPGHGEGHNSGVPLNILAAIAVKRQMERAKLPGTIKVWPGVAEELVAGKAYFVRAGVFKDVDVVIFTHVGNNLSTSWGQSSATGLVSVEYTFKGESAHSAEAPWEGRSALDAVELMDVGWNFRREHLSPLQRSHHVIVDGGDQPNVVPPEATVWYFVRELTPEAIRSNFEVLTRIAEGAAMMTDTKLRRRIVGSAWPRHFNKPIALAVHRNIEATGMPAWSHDDQRFARAVQRLMSAPENGLSSKTDGLLGPPPEPVSG